MLKRRRQSERQYRAEESAEQREVMKSERDNTELAVSNIV